MLHSFQGELAALLTAVFWTITALAFESASKKAGSLSVNLLRLMMAFVFLSLYGLLTTGSLFPLNATSHNWIWLSVSGLIGFVLGDLFLFQSYVVIGARISMLVMALAPPIAAVTGWLMLGETMTALGLIGMVVTLSGISLAILGRKAADENEPISLKPRSRFGLKYPLKGLLLAFGGAAGQGIGLVFSKYGMGDYDAFASSQIRVLTGVIGFMVVITVYGRWKRVKAAVQNLPAMKSLSVGAFFGPFLGVSFSLLAVKYTSTGIASTIMAITPVMIIAPAALLFHEKVSLREVIGAILAVIGVVMFFI